MSYLGVNNNAGIVIAVLNGGCNVVVVNRDLSGDGEVSFLNEGDQLDVVSVRHIVARKANILQKF